MAQQGFLTDIKNIVQKRKAGDISEEQYQEDIIELLIANSESPNRKRAIKCLLSIEPFESLKLLSEID